MSLWMVSVAFLVVGLQSTAMFGQQVSAELTLFQAQMEALNSVIFSLNAWYAPGKTYEDRLKLLWQDKEHPEYKHAVYLDTDKKTGKINHIPFIAAEVMFGSALHSHAGSRQVVKELMRLGVDGNAVDDKGNAALMYSVLYNGALRFLPTLLEDEAKGLSEEAALVAVPAMRKSKRINIDQKNHAGETALMLFIDLVDGGYVDLFELGEYFPLFIRNGADLLIKDNKGKNVLDRAEQRLSQSDNVFSRSRLRATITLLLKAMIEQKKIDNINVRDAQGATYLMRAAHEGNASAVQLLLEYGADETIKNNQGKIALEIVQAALVAHQNNIEQVWYQTVVNLLSHVNGSESPYIVLGLTPHATINEIKKAYKELALKWHPDKNPGNEVETAQKFREVDLAYKKIKEDRKF